MKTLVASRCLAAGAAALLLVMAAGCDDGNGGDEDTGTTDTTVEEDSIAPDTADDPVEDPSTEPDATEDPAEDPAVEDVSEDEVLDCTGMYPGGPYGYRGAIYLNTLGSPVWDPGGGTNLENLGMRNQDDVMVFVAPYYCSSEVDILVYDFTAMWCPPCQMAASEENDFIEWMETNGWTVEFLSVLVEDTAGERPTATDAANWKATYGIHNDVLYDFMGMYGTAPFIDTRPGEDMRGFPTFLFVNPDNMRIWFAFSGWRNPAVTQDEFFGEMLSIFEFGAANDPDYIP